MPVPRSLPKLFFYKVLVPATAKNFTDKPNDECHNHDDQNNAGPHTRFKNTRDEFTTAQ